MTWYAYTMVFYLGLSGLAKIWFIGAPREPVTNEDAIIGLIFTALFIWGILALALA